MYRRTSSSAGRCGRDLPAATMRACTTRRARCLTRCRRPCAPARASRRFREDSARPSPSRARCSTIRASSCLTSPRQHVGDLLRRGHRGDRRRGRIRYDAVSAVRTGVACAHADCPRVASAPVSRWGSRWNHGMNELSCGSHLRCLSCSVCRAASNLRNLGRVLMGFCPVLRRWKVLSPFAQGEKKCKKRQK